MALKSMATYLPCSQKHNATAVHGLRPTLPAHRMLYAHYKLGGSVFLHAVCSACAMRAACFAFPHGRLSLRTVSSISCRYPALAAQSHSCLRSAPARPFSGYAILKYVAGAAITHRLTQVCADIGCEVLENNNLDVLEIRCQLMEMVCKPPPWLKTCVTLKPSAHASMANIHTLHNGTKRSAR